MKNRGSNDERGMRNEELAIAWKMSNGKEQGGQKWGNAETAFVARKMWALGNEKGPSYVANMLDERLERS